MRGSSIALRVASRFQRTADQSPGARKDVKDLVKPINPPKGISKSTVKDSVRTYDNRDDATDPDRRDLRPQDVFQPKPKNMNVLDWVTKGWPGTAEDYTDMEKAIRKQIPKDKGYATVKNLSQYLVETDGGGGTKAVGK